MQRPKIDLTGYDQAQLAELAESLAITANQLYAEASGNGRALAPVPTQQAGDTDLILRIETLAAYNADARAMLGKPQEQASVPASRAPEFKPSKPSKPTDFTVQGQSVERMTATQRCQLSIAERELAEAPEREQLNAIMARTDLTFTAKCELANQLRRNVSDLKIEAQLREAGHTVTPNRKLNFTEQCLLARGFSLDTKVTS